MEIMINGERRDLDEGCTLQSMLKDLSLTGKRLAIEVNEDIIPRNQYPLFTLNTDDQVEIIHAIGGG